MYVWHIQQNRYATYSLGKSIGHRGNYSMPYGQADAAEQMRRNTTGSEKEDNKAHVTQNLG